MRSLPKVIELEQRVEALEDSIRIRRASQFDGDLNFKALLDHLKLVVVHKPERRVVEPKKDL